MEASFLGSSVGKGVPHVPSTEPRLTQLLQRGRVIPTPNTSRVLILLHMHARTDYHTFDLRSPESLTFSGLRGKTQPLNWPTQKTSRKRTEHPDGSPTDFPSPASRVSPCRSRRRRSPLLDPPSRFWPSWPGEYLMHRSGGGFLAHFFFCTIVVFNNQLVFDCFL